MSRIFDFGRKRFVKLPAHKAGLPSKVISFYIVPFNPARFRVAITYKAGFAGHIPVKMKRLVFVGKGEV
jgi:hypothetical protein